MQGKQFLEELKERIIIGDGAMGTMLHEKGVPWEINFDTMNLMQPELVKSIHLEYIAAGAQFIETNTFGANANKLAATEFSKKVREINLAGGKIARESVNSNIAVAGSVGPLGKPRLENGESQGEEEKAAVFQEQIQALRDSGVDLLILESFPTADELLLALRVARSITEIPIICQLAVLDRLDPSQEIWAAKQLLELITYGADCIGGNCGSGPAYLIKIIQRLSQMTDFPISAFPNLSFPQYINGRYVYISDPNYFAESAVKLADSGANLIGGCCGTTPHHIRLISQKLKDRKPSPRILVEFSEKKHDDSLKSTLPSFPNLLEKINKKKIIVIELDPPRGIGYGEVLEGARSLAKEGADAISIAENPLASIRMSAFALGYLVQKEAGILAVPHCTCRDRNLLGQQSELMGAWALGLNHILLITGDPTSIGGALGCSSVFDTNSYGLIEMAVKLNQGINIAGNPIAYPTNFIIGCAFNPNKINMDAEIKRLKKKMNLGAKFAQSQIVYDPEKIKEMYAKTKELEIPIFCGIMPLISYRNAEFLHNEVPGFSIPEEVRRRMKNVEGEKEKGIQEGIKISRELIETALEAGAPGIYMVTPFNKWRIMAELCRHIRALTPVAK